MKRLTLNKKIIAQKRELLLRMLMENNGDFLICEEALNVLYEVFGDVDLTLVEYSNSSLSMLATTLNNEDNINALLSVVRYYISKNANGLAEKIQIKARPDVYETKPISLTTGEICTYLIIDVYEEGYVFDKESLKDVLDVLSLLVKVSILERDRKKAYKVDNLTRVYTRDSLIDDISTVLDAEILEKDDVCLATLYISNASYFNKTKGYAYMDSLLLKIAQVLLNNEKKGYVYRIGGMKFAILSKKSIQDVFSLMNKIFEQIKVLDPDLSCTAAVVPIFDDPYRTLYSAECNLKEADGYTIAVYRNDPASIIADDKGKFDNIEIADVENLAYQEDIIERHMQEQVVEVYDSAEASEGVEPDEGEAEDEEDIVLSFEDFEDEDEEEEDEEEPLDDGKKKFGKGLFDRNGQMSIFT